MRCATWTYSVMRWKGYWIYRIGSLQTLESVSMAKILISIVQQQWLLKLVSSTRTGIECLDLKLIGAAQQCWMLLHGHKLHMMKVVPAIGQRMLNDQTH